MLGAEATRTRERGMGDEDRGVGGTTLWGWSPPAWSCPPCRTTIWSHRVRFLEERALPHWATFTIWNAGRQGRRLYRSLTPGARAKVVAFCDVDEKKIKKGFYCYEDSKVCGQERGPGPQG